MEGRSWNSCLLPASRGFGSLDTFHAFWGVSLGLFFWLDFFGLLFLFKILLKEWQPYFKHCCVINTATNSISADCPRACCSSKHGIGVCPSWCIYYISGFAWRAEEYKTYLLLSHSSSLQNKHCKDNLYLETASSSCIQLWSGACFQCFLNTLTDDTIFLPYFIWVITVINPERNGFFSCILKHFFLPKCKHSF